MKPSSHREQPSPRQSCGNCAFRGYQRNLHDLLCYHGDSVDDIIDAELLDGCDELDRWWSARLTDASDTCIEFKEGGQLYPPEEL